MTTSNYSPSDLKLAFYEGQLNTIPFKDLLQDKVFCSHPELYSVAQEILKEKDQDGNISPALVRVYSVLTSKNVSSLPSYYHFFSKSALNSSIQECEKNFNKDFDTFFNDHSSLVSNVNPADQAYFEDHLKGHFKQIEDRLKTFDRPIDMELSKDWNTLKIALMHDDFSTAKAAWDRILEKTITYFPFKNDNSKITNKKLSLSDKKEAEIFLKHGLSQLEQYLKVDNLSSQSEYDDFIVVSEDVGILEEAEDNIKQIVEKLIKSGGNKVVDSNEGPSGASSHISDPSQAELDAYSLEIINIALEKSPKAIEIINIHNSTGIINSTEVDKLSKLLPECTNVKTVILDLSQININDAQKIADSLASLNQLGSLSLINVKNPRTLDIFLKALKTLPHLKELSITKHQPVDMLTEAQMKHIIDKVKTENNKLRVLNFSDTSITLNAQRLLFDELKNLSNIQLVLSHRYIRSEFKHSIVSLPNENNIRVFFEGRRPIARG